ncbi:hypothetical protein AX16_003301 [Volvariella volvacea WC 439]|nr:hypothetical protein AX16_003301 [Volvariella volvacea WC 439]
MMRSTYFTIFTLFCALFIGIQVTGAAGAVLPNINTNAGRLARGLPLFKPRFSKNISRNMTPTRADLAARGQPSGTPHDKRQGYIQVVRASNGLGVGYISNQFFSDTQRRFEVDNSVNNRLFVKFAEGSNVNVEIYNGPGAWGYLGWTTTSGTGSVTNAGSSPSLEVVASNDNPNSTPSTVGNSFNNGASSTRIWSYNSNNNYMTIQWTNPNGAAATTKFWYNPSDGSLRGVRSGFGGAGYEVYLKYVEN